MVFNFLKKFFPVSPGVPRMSVADPTWGRSHDHDEGGSLAFGQNLLEEKTIWEGIPPRACWGLPRMLASDLSPARITWVLDKAPLVFIPCIDFILYKGSWVLNFSPQFVDGSIAAAVGLGPVISPKCVSRSLASCAISFPWRIMCFFSTSSHLKILQFFNFHGNVLLSNEQLFTLVGPLIKALFLI